MRQNKFLANKNVEQTVIYHPLVFGLFLVVVTLISYQPVWHAGFIWDDDAFLTENPVIKSAHGLYQIWFTTSTPDYYPVTSSMLWLEWRLWAGNPFGYHLVNVLLHASSAVLLWRTLQRLKIHGAWLAAAIFALHPVNVESVAWITERKNTLAMFFYVCTLLAWLKSEEGGQSRWYGLALACFALALLSKTAVVPLPVVLLGLAWWRHGRVGWKDFLRIVPFFGIAAVLGLVTVWFQHQAIGPDIVRTDNYWSRLAGAGWAIWFYLWKAMLPFNLTFVYPRWQISTRNILSYLPLVLVAVAFLWCWRHRRGRCRSLLFVLGYFVLMLLPILGFFNIYFMRYSLVADHWQYFAIIGPIAFSAAFIRRPALAAGLLLILGMLTWKQCGMYVDAETLWQQTIRLNPGCWLARCQLGTLFNQQGRLDEAIAQYQKALALKPDYAEARYNLGLTSFQLGRMDEAIAQYQKALTLKPDYAEALNNLGLVFCHLGRLDEAIAQYQKALALKPEVTDIRNNLGIVLLRQGRTNEALAQYQRVLATQPDNAEAHFNLGDIYGKEGRTDEAIEQYQTALAIRPNYFEAKDNLGLLFFQAGRMDEAIAHLQQALALKPDDANVCFNLGLCFRKQGRLEEAIAYYQKALQIEPANAKALNNLAWLLATGPEAMLRDGKKAVELARQANALAGGDNPLILHTLAAAFAEAGQFSEAVETAQRAMGLAWAQSNTALAKTIQSEMELYQARKPYHFPPQPH